MKRFAGDRRLRWFRFCPTEYVADTNLMSCSLAAQGLWMQLICMMTQSERYGVLMLHGKPTDLGDLARLLRVKVRIVAPLMAELDRQGVYSIDPDGYVFSRRMVREYSQDQADRVFGKQGGNSALMAPKPDAQETPAPEPDRRVGAANDHYEVMARRKSREADAKRGRNVGETDVKLMRNVGETDVKRSPNVVESDVKRDRNVGESDVHVSTIFNDPSKLSKSRVNPPQRGRVNAESETETETESETESETERNSAEGDGAVTRDTPATSAITVGLMAEPDVEDGARPVSPGWAEPVTSDPGSKRGERFAPHGTAAELADESRALASWNTLAAATGMMQGTMNAETRRRIRTILAIGGGLSGWDAALAAAETAPHWNGTGSSDWRPTIGSFCKPDLFAKLLNGEYVSRERVAPVRPRSARDQAAVDAMGRIMARAAGGAE